MVAGHLLGAGRFQEAVPACLQAAEEAVFTELAQLSIPEAHSVAFAVVPTDCTASPLSLLDDGPKTFPQNWGCAAADSGSLP